MAQSLYATVDFGDRGSSPLEPEIKQGHAQINLQRSHPQHSSPIQAVGAEASRQDELQCAVWQVPTHLFSITPKAAGLIVRQVNGGARQRKLQA